jgi:hypothetical protein
MPFNVRRSVNTVRKEILKFPVGIDSVESVVLRASGVAALASAVTGVQGKLGLLAGTILTKVSGDSQNRYKRYTGSGDIEGILGDNVFFYDGTDASDEPADMLFHGCVFDSSKIIDFASYESAVRTALPTCRFD